MPTISATSLFLIHLSFVKTKLRRLYPMADVNKIAAGVTLATGLLSGALAGSSNSEDQKAGWDGLSSIVSEKAGDNKEETEAPPENNSSSTSGSK
jgi:hypothetical protein